MHVKILQWNIWYKEKIENIIDFLKKVDADILCLQELTINGPWNNYKDTIKVISKKLRLHAQFAPAHRFPEGNTSGNGILSKFPIKNVNVFPIQDPSKTRNGFDYEKRVCISADIEINKKIKLKVATTQLSYTPKFRITKQKKREIKKILAFLKQQSRRFIFTGDFNAGPNSYTIKEIKRFLNHCGPAYKEPTWTTKPFNYQGFIESKLRWRIDYVFSTPDIKTVFAKIIKTSYSDHFPLLVEIEI